MPGPVSDSYDPEFGTASNAEDVREALKQVRCTISQALGPKLLNIVQISQGMDKSSCSVNFDERECRIIRFAIDRALESI